MTFVVAIDGPAGSGKGTLAIGISKKFNFSYFDTGSLYRGLALQVLNVYGENFSKNDVITLAKNFSINSIDEESLRSSRIGKYSSIIASIPEVRSILIKIQRGFKEENLHQKGIVVDGRDIGTVIFPNANIKFFVSASIKERAKRRLTDFSERNEIISYNEVIKQLQKRDQRDKERSVAPLVAAKDAHLVDTTCINKEEALKIVSSLIIVELDDYMKINK